jgi:hypothetical protein
MCFDLDRQSRLSYSRSRLDHEYSPPAVDGVPFVHRTRLPDEHMGCSTLEVSWNRKHSARCHRPSTPEVVRLGQHLRREVQVQWACPRSML